MVSCQLSYPSSQAYWIKGRFDQNLVQMVSNTLRCSFYLLTHSHEWLKMILKTDVLSSPLEFFFYIFLKAYTNSWSRRPVCPYFVLLCSLSNSFIHVLMVIKISSAGLKSNILCSIPFFFFFYIWAFVLIVAAATKLPALLQHVRSSLSWFFLYFCSCFTLVL